MHDGGHAAVRKPTKREDCKNSVRDGKKGSNESTSKKNAKEKRTKQHWLKQKRSQRPSGKSKRWNAKKPFDVSRRKDENSWKKNFYLPSWKKQGFSKRLQDEKQKRKQKHNLF